jgi:hypothetical protein
MLTVLTLMVVNIWGFKVNFNFNINIPHSNFNINKYQ